MGTGALSGKPDEIMGGNHAMEEHPLSENFPSRFLVGNQNKLRLSGPLGPSADLAFTFLFLYNTASTNN